MVIGTDKSTAIPAFFGQYHAAMLTNRRYDPDPFFGMGNNKRLVEDGYDKVITHGGDLVDPACAQPFPGEDRLFLKPEKFFGSVNLTR